MVAGTIRAILVALIVISSCGKLIAQRQREPTFEIGDQVAFEFGDQWIVGKLIDIGTVCRVEVEDERGRIRERICGRSALRFEWQTRAMTPMRFWTDQSGKFRIRAALVGLKKGYARLHKQDGSEVSVEVSKLSEAGQAMIRRIQERFGPEVSDNVEPVEFSPSVQFGSAAWNSATSLASIAPDPPPSFSKIPMKGAVFPKAYLSEEIVLVRPIGGSDGWMLAATKDAQKAKPSRVIWATLEQESVKKMQRLPATERVVDVDPPNRAILSINESDRDNAVLTLWSASPHSEKATPVASWYSRPERSLNLPNYHWASIIGPGLVLHRWARQQFVAWDVNQERLLYVIQHESSSLSKPVLSPGRKYIALPESEQVRVLETRTGKTLAQLPVKGRNAHSVAFAPDGTKLSVLSDSFLQIWGFSSTQPPQTYKADSVHSSSSGSLDWVSDDSFLVDRELLFDLRFEMPVWKYSADSGVARDSRDTDTQSVLDGKLCYAADIDQGSKFFVVGAAELPGPMVDDVLSNLTSADKYLIDRGEQIHLVVKCGQFTQQVTATLTQQIQANGWVLNPNSTTVLTAEMTRGERQSVTYQSFFPGQGRKTYPATVTPYISRMTMTKDKRHVWGSLSIDGHLPMFLTLRPGETAQSRVSNTEKPNPDFFRVRKIPAQIINPIVRIQGFGSSEFGNRGLEPRSR